MLSTVVVATSALHCSKAHFLFAAPAPRLVLLQTPLLKYKVDTWTGLSSFFSSSLVYLFAESVYSAGGLDGCSTPPLSLKHFEHIEFIAAEPQKSLHLVHLPCSWETGVSVVAELTGLPELSG